MLNDKGKDIFLQKVRKTKRKHSKRVKKIVNVTGIGVGYKIVNNKKTDQLCIRIYVSKKVPKEELDPEDIIPKTIDSIPTDVIEKTFIIMNDVDEHREKHNPLTGGISLGNLTLGGSGTLGVSVFDNETNKDMMLSNWHVLCGRNNCRVGETIIQPGQGGGDTGTAKDVVGYLYRSSLTNLVDAAIAILTGHRFLDKTVLKIGSVDDIGVPEIDLEVRKSGRTTGLTSGVIIDDEADVTIRGYPGGSRDFDNQILVENGEIVKPGDSGSVFVDNENRVVALLFAGSNDYKTAIANPIDLVLSELEINLKSGITMQNFIAATHSLLS